MNSTQAITYFRNLTEQGGTISYSPESLLQKHLPIFHVTSEAALDPLTFRRAFHKLTGVELKPDDFHTMADRRFISVNLDITDTSEANRHRQYKKMGAMRVLADTLAEHGIPLHSARRTDPRVYEGQLLGEEFLQKLRDNPWMLSLERQPDGMYLRFKDPGLEPGAPQRAQVEQDYVASMGVLMNRFMRETPNGADGTLSYEVTDHTPYFTVGFHPIKSNSASCHITSVAQWLKDQGVEFKGAANLPAKGIV